MSTRYQDRLHFLQWENALKSYSIDQLKEVIRAREHEYKCAHDMIRSGIDAKEEAREANVIKSLAENEILNRNGAIQLALSIGLAGKPLPKVNPKN